MHVRLTFSVCSSSIVTISQVYPGSADGGLLLCRHAQAKVHYWQRGGELILSLDVIRFGEYCQAFGLLGEGEHHRT